MLRLVLCVRLVFDRAPERRGDHACGFRQRQFLPADEIIQYICDDFGVRLQRAFVAEHLDVPAVRVVGGDLAVVHDGIVEQRERMRAAPPAGRVGRIAAVCRPGVALVLVEAVIHADVLGETDRLERAHVLAARENVRAFLLGIDMHDGTHDEFLFVELQIGENGLHGRNEVAPDHRLVRDLRQLARRDALRLVDLKTLFEERFTRFARVYTPIVVGAAIILALLPPLFSGNFTTAFPDWLYRALLFLVVSCPCALVISVPLTFFGGIGGASRNGILVKGSSYMDILARLGTVVFDKTGTLTHGQFTVTAVHPDTCDERHLLHLAAHVEHFSTHPIGAALRDAFPDEATDGCIVSDVEEVAGQGIRARVADQIVCVGNTKMMDFIGAKWHDCHHVGTIIHVAIDGAYAGHIVINDQIKDDSAEAIVSLKELGINRIVMLTGDRREVGEQVASQLDLMEYHTELLPAEKVKHVEQLLNEKGDGTGLAFVGDGINDAPVLARADVGIAMGGLGSDAAIEAADVVIMDDRPSRIAIAIRIARRTIAIARQNIWLAIGIKVAILILAAFGLGTMWMAVFADVGVTILAVLNAIRALKV